MSFGSFAPRVSRKLSKAAPAENVPPSKDPKPRSSGGSISIISADGMEGPGLSVFFLRATLVVGLASFP